MTSQSDELQLRLNKLHESSSGRMCPADVNVTMSIGFQSVENVAYATFSGIHQLLRVLRRWYTRSTPADECRC